MILVSFGSVVLYCSVLCCVVLCCSVLCCIVLHDLSFRVDICSRMKSDVEKSLPPKEEVIVEVEMTLPQKKYYRSVRPPPPPPRLPLSYLSLTSTVPRFVRAIYEKNLAMLSTPASMGKLLTKTSLTNVSLALRKVGRGRSG